MGEYIAQVKSVLDYLEDLKPSTAYPTGILDDDHAHIRYAPKSSDYPNLTILEYISDKENNIIEPGYYLLMLSYDRTMLVLVQQEKVIATFPVFKLEEDKNQEEAQPRTKKELKKQEKEKKKKAKKREKLKKEGKIPPEDEVYSNATIQYDEAGDYYLVKYERGKIRAWGAIKY